MTIQQLNSSTDGHAALNGDYHTSPNRNMANNYPNTQKSSGCGCQDKTNDFSESKERLVNDYVNLEDYHTHNGMPIPGPIVDMPIPDNGTYAPMQSTIAPFAQSMTMHNGYMTDVPFK